MADRVNTPQHAMALTKIGTVGKASAVPSLRTTFWGRGVMIRSCPLYPVGSSNGYRSVRKRTFSATYPRSYYNPHKEKETVIEELGRLLGNAALLFAE
jgi:hypothetical protein